MARLDWLTARPIAHRGLHDASGPVENTASAFSAAIASNYGIECDLQISADGEAMVHHDDALGRLTEGSGRLADLPAAQIKTVRFKRGGDRILTLGELCDLVAGRAPLVLELKSHFDGDRRLVERTAAVLANYQGPSAAMSFDPAMVEMLRTIAPMLTRGLVAQRRYNDWPGLSPDLQQNMGRMLHLRRTEPQFIAYAIRDLPALMPLALRIFRKMPLLTWTVRTQAEWRRAAFWTDQIIFEGWRP
jgi:glycerophosphoryl diester phosphodiesterase